MHVADQERTNFQTDKGIYCYKVMSFGLKNARATYQRMVNKIFKNVLGKNMEVYVDDMLNLQLQSALQFEFEASNNEVEHEAMIASLQLAKEVGTKNIELYSDSQLVVNQVSVEYQTKGEKMTSYVAKT
ncbi:uncharacterized protein LOC115713228 [Cannabis sativa]|uniref:uncharacterized protein LOC115713228 n=1 Tax=Cannabis sativa TaxID=3483 RepID=UPI0029CA58EE|nr:uncharacterized protein LOC115713228 [Cannabis sativa]